MAAGSEESCGQGKRGVDQEAGCAGGSSCEGWEDLMGVHAECQPIMPSAVKKDEELTLGQEEMLQRWHQHFSRISRVSSVRRLFSRCQYCHLVSILMSHLLRKSW